MKANLFPHIELISKHIDILVVSQSKLDDTFPNS